MRIRSLKLTDAKYMLEWMNDKNVTQYLEKDFSMKRLEDCITFIDNCNTEREINLAIVNDDDEYMGTVSLKDINKEQGYAEFAITIRTCAMGKGYSLYAMNEMLRIGFEEMHLKYIIWCVKSENARAIKFYNKNGFQQTNVIPLEIKKKYSQDDIVWYYVQK